MVARGRVVTKKEVEAANKKKTASIDEFNAIVRDFATRLVPEMFLEFQITVVIDLYGRIVERTPVDTGLARGNWQITIDTPATDPIERTVKGGANSVTSAEAANLRQLSGYRVVWISNKLDYISFLETGSSFQAPEGMIAVSVQEFSVSFRSPL